MTNRACGGSASTAPASTPPLLMSVVVVSRNWPAVDSLDHVRQSIDSCLDPSCRFSVEKAVATGSHRLLERVLFSLRNKSTVDEFVRQLWLRRGFQAAVRRGDAEAAQLIHQQYPGYLAANALELAAERGDVTLFTWLYLHRPEERDCTPRALIIAAANGHLDTVRLLLEPSEELQTESAPVPICPSGALRAAIEHGHCSVAQYLFERGVRAQLSVLDAEVARRGHFEMVQRLHSTGLPGVFTTAAMDAAAKNGHFEIVQFLHEHRQEGCRSWAMDGAATGGYLDIVEFLFANRREGCTARAVNGAARNGHINVLQWLFDNLRQSSSIWTPEAVTNALAHGHYDVLAWFQTHFMSLCSKIPPYSALEIAKEGNLRGLQMLHYLHGPDVRWSPRVMDVAAASGDLKMIQWLLENRPNDGAGAAMIDRAAEAGHMDTVKWLHDRGLACTHWAMDKAATGGFLHVVKWLHENRSEGCSMNAMKGAAAYGHMDVVKWLHENRTESTTSDAMDAAAIGGHLEVVIWLHVNRSEGCTSEAIDSAAALGNYEVVQWLLANRPSIACSRDGLSDAASRGRLRIVKMLVAHFNMRLDHRGVVAAARNGYLDVVEWAFETYQAEDLDLEQCRAEAERHGRFHIVQWLDRRRIR